MNREYGRLALAALMQPRGVALLFVAASLFLSGCASSSLPQFDKSSDPFEQSHALFAEGHYDAALKENQRVLAEGKGTPDIALFNIGLISAYSANPKKDYARALGSFKTLLKEHPQSPLVEPAKVWIQVLEEHQKALDERRKLAEDRRTLIREKEMLAQEREKLHYAVERSRQVDIEIEKRRRRTKTK